MEAQPVNVLQAKGNEEIVKKLIGEGKTEGNQGQQKIIFQGGQQQFNPYLSGGVQYQSIGGAPLDGYQLLENGQQTPIQYSQVIGQPVGGQIVGGQGGQFVGGPQFVVGQGGPVNAVGGNGLFYSQVVDRSNGNPIQGNPSQGHPLTQSVQQKINVNGAGGDTQPEVLGQQQQMSKSMAGSQINQQNNLIHSQYVGTTYGPVPTEEEIKDGSHSIKGTSYYEYIPYTKTITVKEPKEIIEKVEVETKKIDYYQIKHEVELKPQSRIETYVDYVEQEVIEYEEVITIEYVPVQKVEYIPHKRIVKVPVERTEEKTEYQQTFKQVE